MYGGSRSAQFSDAKEPRRIFPPNASTSNSRFGDPLSYGRQTKDQMASLSRNSINETRLQHALPELVNRATSVKAGNTPAHINQLSEFSEEQIDRFHVAFTE
jgi:hypothetical protein